MKVKEIPSELMSFIRNHLYLINKPLKIVKLECINDKGCKWLNNREWYYGWKSTGTKAWYNDYEDYDVYKIIHPILGPRKYDPKRFKILDTLLLTNKLFLENVQTKNSKNKD